MRDKPEVATTKTDLSDALENASPTTSKNLASEICGPRSRNCTLIEDDGIFLKNVLNAATVITAQGSMGASTQYSVIVVADGLSSTGIASVTSSSAVGFDKRSRLNLRLFLSPPRDGCSTLTSSNNLFAARRSDLYN